jgi:hypothetical protein
MGQIIPQPTPPRQEEVVDESTGPNPFDRFLYRTLTRISDPEAYRALESVEKDIGESLPTKVWAQYAQKTDQLPEDNWKRSMVGGTTGGITGAGVGTGIGALLSLAMPLAAPALMWGGGILGSMVGGRGGSVLANPSEVDYPITDDLLAEAIGLGVVKGGAPLARVAKKGVSRVASKFAPTVGKKMQQGIAGRDFATALNSAQSDASSLRSKQPFMPEYQPPNAVMDVVGGDERVRAIMNQLAQERGAKRALSGATSGPSMGTWGQPLPNGFQMGEGSLDLIGRKEFDRTQVLQLLAQRAQEAQMKKRASAMVPYDPWIAPGVAKQGGIPMEMQGNPARMWTPSGEWDDYISRGSFVDAIKQATPSSGIPPTIKEWLPNASKKKVSVNTPEMQQRLRQYLISMYPQP